MASRIDRTVQSMLATIPLRSPRQGTEPTPRIVRSSPSTSATTAHTLVVPMSNPTTISPWDAVTLIERQSHTPTGRAKSSAAIPAPTSSLAASAEPNDDTVGPSVVVQQDGIGLGSSPIEFGNHVSCL